MKKYSVLEKVKNLIERTPGYSWCQHCGKTWDKVEYKPIPYVTKIPEFSNSGMFPVCVSCFNELSSEKILEYCKELIDSWKKNGVSENIDFDIIRFNIAEMKKEK